MALRTFSVSAFFVFLSLIALALAQTEPELSGDAVLERVGPSVVVVIAGSANGPVYATGLVGRSDGTVLTAYHAVKDAREVQVRLKNGEIFDQVALIGFDARRDVAALRISATGLRALPNASLADIRSGQTVFVLSHAAGLTWSASSGIVSSIRMADEVPGAGKGYRLLQFTAPVSPGSSGGVVVDGQARVVGLVTGTLTGGQNLNFAVPIESVSGLANSAGGMTFASGASLQLPAAARDKSVALPAKEPVPLTPRAPDAFATSQPVVAQPVNPSGEELSAAIQNRDPRQILRAFRSVYVLSKTTYAKPEVIQSALHKEPAFQAWGLFMVADPQVADLRLTIDRPLFTFTYTYELAHQNSGIILETGKVKGASDGVVAPKIARSVVERIAEARGWPPGIEPVRKKESD